MISVVEGVRKIVEAEVRKLHLAELGVITSVYPHSSDGDKQNYECDVRLRDKEVELRKVPVATQHIGLAHIPHVGDLVLLTFINGDINSPIIIGRLYNDEDRPPSSSQEEIVYKPPYRQNSGLRRIYVHLPAGTVKITLHDDFVNMHVGSTDIMINGKGVQVETSQDITMKSEGDASLSAKGDVNDEAEGDLNLKADGDINIKASGNINLEASGNLTIKGAKVDINP